MRPTPPCQVLPSNSLPVFKKVAAGITFYYTTEEELRQKVSQELARVRAKIEVNEREYKVAIERRDTLGLYCKAMKAFPWLNDALTVYYQHKETLELERRYFTLQLAASYLGLSPKTVYTWAEGQKIPGHKLGRVWRFDREELDNFVQGEKRGVLYNPLSAMGFERKEA